MRENEVPTRETIIGRQVDVLYKQAEELSELSARLGNRLTSVLTPTSTDNCKTPTNETNTIIPFARRLEDLSDRISGSLDYIGEIIDRIEI